MPLTSSRRNGSAGGTPLWLIFFGVFLVFSLAVTGAIYWAADAGSREDLLRRAETRLAPLVESKRAYLVSVAASTEAALGAASTWDLSDFGDSEAVRLILQSAPHLHSLTFVSRGAQAVHLQQDGESWIEEKMNLVNRSSEWGRWDASFAKLLSLESGLTKDDPRQADWYEGAIIRMQSRADENRNFPPQIFWATPKRLATSAPGIVGAVAIKRANEEPVVIAFEVDLSQLAGDATIETRMESTMVVSERAGIVAPPQGAQLEGLQSPDSGFAPLDSLEGLPIFAAFQRWRYETNPPETAFRGEFGGASAWSQFARFDGFGGETLWIGASIPQDNLRIGFIRLRTQLFLILAGAIGCALVVALLLAAGLTRTVRAFSSELWRVDGLDANHAHLPRSRVREFNELASATNALLADVQPPAVTGVEAELPAAPAEPEGFQAPPQAYLQALQSSRRQLRELQGHLETLQRQAHADGGTGTSSEAHWKTLLQRLGEENDVAARGVLVELGCTLAGVERFGLWHADGNECVLLQRFDMLGNTFDEGSACPANVLPQGLLSASQGPILTALDAVGAAGFPLPAESAHPTAAALVVTFLGDGGQTLMLMLEQVSAAVRWTPAQEQNALALAALFCLSEKADTPEIILSPEPLKGLAFDTEIEEEYGEAPLFRQLIQSVGQPLAAILPDGRISFVNTAFEDFFDRDAQDLLGYPYWDLIADESLDTVRDSINTVMESGRSQSTVAWHAEGNNPPAQLHMDMSALEDEHGEVTGTVIRLRPTQPETE